MAGASVGIMATPLPWKLLDDVSIWTQNWGWIPSLKPGENSFSVNVSKTCPSNVATTIRLVGGRPVRVLPSPAHPLGGGVSAVAVAEVQMLHSPGRVHKPLKRGPDGALVQIQWSEAMELLAAKLTAAKAKTAFISGDETGSTNEVLSAFARALGSEAVFLMPSEGQAAAKAAELAGVDAAFGYDLEGSDYIFAAGANILETWGPAIRNRRVFSAAHPHPVEGAKATMTLVYAGPVQNNTAAVAGSWLAVQPGTEGVLLLGLANQLIARGRTAPAGDFAEFKALVAAFGLEETAKQTGLPKEAITRLVDGLLAAKAPLVIAGGEAGNGAGTILAGFAVNALLGNINKKGGMTLLPEAPTVVAGAASRRELYKRDLAAWLAGKDLPEVLVIHEANPVYALPEPKKTLAALKKIPFKVSFSTMMDETAAASDLVIPIPMGLERVDDLYTPYGFGQSIYCQNRVVVEPAERSLPTAAALLFMAKQLASAKVLAADLGFATFADLLKAKAVAMKGNFDLLMKGQPVLSKETVALGDFSLRPDVLGKALAPRKTGDGLALALFSKLNFGTPKTGFAPFAVKTLRANELEGRDMSVMMNSATAAAKGISAGDRVKLTANGASIGARVALSEGVVPGAVAVSPGFGHTALDAFSQNKGANVMDILSARAEPETGLSAWSQAGIVVTKA